jgi:ribosome-associated toxin RatA of RatAB toxin-antitoxin module
MGNRVKTERKMQVSKDKLFEAITDFKSYAEFVPEVVSVKVHPGASETGAQVTFELEVVKRFQYTLEFSMKGHEEVHWKLVESNFFKANEGSWILSANGDATDVKYELDVAFGFLVPGWITKKLTETSLPKMLDNFEERAKKLQSGK